MDLDDHSHGHTHRRTHTNTPNEQAQSLPAAWGRQSASLIYHQCSDSGARSGKPPRRFLLHADPKGNKKKDRLSSSNTESGRAGLINALSGDRRLPKQSPPLAFVPASCSFPANPAPLQASCLFHRFSRHPSHFSDGQSVRITERSKSHRVFTE